MSYFDNKRYVLEHIDRRTLLEQLAEEAAELSQAALKLIRAEKLSDNPTPANVSIASEQLIEELADVLVAADAVGVPILESCDNSKVSAKYSCGFSNTLISSIIVGERYLDYFTTITEDRLWQLLAKPVFRWRNSSGLSMNAAKAV